VTRSRQSSPLTVTPTPPASPARVAFVGAGPGDPGLMTVRGRDLLAAADVVILDRIASEDVVRTTRARTSRSSTPATATAARS
jgi:uroporphyrinogen III methyltransferase/synthase